MRAVDSPKNWTNKFGFFPWRVKKNSFVRSFFGRIYVAPICLRFYLTKVSGDISSVSPVPLCSDGFEHLKSPHDFLMQKVSQSWEDNFSGFLYGWYHMVLYIIYFLCPNLLLRLDHIFLPNNFPIATTYVLGIWNCTYSKQNKCLAEDFFCYSSLDSC